MSQRIQKVNELIKRELSQIILKEINFPQSVLVTLTRVESSIDLRSARVFVSVLFTQRSPAPVCGRSREGSEGGPERKTVEVFRILNKELYDLQQRLNKRLNMRPIPRIRFVEEKEVRGAARIEDLLEKINPHHFKHNL